jgi:DsbC/DsbD-like thiol-disulfide interchange protein
VRSRLALVVAVAVGVTLAGWGPPAPASAQTRTPSGAATPDWLDEVPASRVSTRHLIAEAEALDARVPADGRVTLVLRVTPKPGMRIYAHDVTGYVPLSLHMDAVEGSTLERTTYPASTWYEFPPTRERSRVYQEPVTIRQTLVLSSAARRALERGVRGRLTATIRYQACDARLCYRPEEARIAW